MKEIKINTEGPNYVHLFSGGLDSTYGLLKLARDIKDDRKPKGIIQPIFIDYGHFAAPTEWKQAQTIAAFINTKLRKPSIIRKPIWINLKSDLFKWCHNVAFTGKEVGEDTCEIQNRNMVLLSVLFSYLLACAQNRGIKRASFEIYSGFKEGEMGDCSCEFFNSLTSIFGTYQNEYPMKVVLLPYASRAQTYAKLKRLLRGNQSDLNELLSMTTSCYAPIDGRACETCYKCRKIAQEKQKIS